MLVSSAKREELSMKLAPICLVILSLCVQRAHATPASSVDLGAAANFAVLGGSSVTNSGATNIQGSVGVSPGNAITGFPPGTISGGALHAGDAASSQAHSDLGTAYNAAAGEAGGTVLTGSDLGGMTLLPGIYSFASSAQLTGTLTLDTQGDPNAVFLFQIGSTLTTASASSVVFANGIEDSKVFWQVGSSATLGTGTAFLGNVLALTSITLNNAASIQDGRALAVNGSVMLNTNSISIPSVSSVPEPGSALLFGMGALCLGAEKFRRLSRSQAPARS
jgi:type VI secretion system secreted protein VgrG